MVLSPTQSISTKNVLPLYFIKQLMFEWTNKFSYGPKSKNYTLTNKSTEYTCEYLLIV